MAIGGLAAHPSVAVSPDGHTVLVTAADDDAVSSFRRDPATGALARASCFAGRCATPGCSVSTLLARPARRHLPARRTVAWVAASRGNALVTFQVDPADEHPRADDRPGRLPARDRSANCRAARALDDVRGLAVSADGTARLRGQRAQRRDRA